MNLAELSVAVSDKAKAIELVERCGGRMVLLAPIAAL
jgi:hypothetical protein